MNIPRISLSTALLISVRNIGILYLYNNALSAWRLTLLLYFDLEG